MTAGPTPPDAVVRRMDPGEFDTMRAVAVDAFGEHENIGELLDLLRASWCWIDELAFVATIGDEIIGQILYTHALVDAPASLIEVLVLSPLAVRPDVSHLGVGAQLVTESLRVVATRPEPAVFVQGDPRYYERFGFRAAAELGFTKPSRHIPDAAFQVIRLPSWHASVSGALVYPDPFWRTDTVALRDR